MKHSVQQSIPSLRRKRRSSFSVRFPFLSGGFILLVTGFASFLFGFSSVGYDLNKIELRGNYVTLHELRHYFKCDNVFATTRPIWTPDQWREVRDLYREFAQHNSRGTRQLDKDDLFDSTGIAVPFQNGNEKGRGLKAGRDIRKGEVILKFTNNTVVFNDGPTYRKFLFAVEERFPSFACDFTIWSWIQDLDDEGLTFGIVTDLNNNNLLNNGHADANIQCGAPGVEDSCDASHDLTFYALQDIREGEELIGDYSDFVSYHSWEEMGM